MILLADLENQLFSIALYSEEGRKEHAFSTFAEYLFWLPEKRQPGNLTFACGGDTAL